MKEFDLFVPLFHNDGIAIDPKSFQTLQKKLLESSAHNGVLGFELKSGVHTCIILAAAYENR